MFKIDGKRQSSFVATSTNALLLCAVIMVITSGFVRRAQARRPAPEEAQRGGGGTRALYKAQSSSLSVTDESMRSDKFTGGSIKRASFQAGQPDIEITVNVPAFQLTLWQNGKEVKTYPIGVGRKEFPISIGERQAKEVIWNPSWIPPDSSWVANAKSITAGEVITAKDPRNPLGKLKIPLGYGYLIHQARQPADLGNLVSHGCIRMLKNDLYDLAEKIVAARAPLVSWAQIQQAKETTGEFVAALNTPLVVDINYDTQVVEDGVLHLYPDVYERATNTVESLRAELESSGVDASRLNDKVLKQILNRIGRTKEFAVDAASLEAGRALRDGRSRPLVKRSTPPAAKTPTIKAAQRPRRVTVSVKPKKTITPRAAKVSRKSVAKR